MLLRSASKPVAVLPKPVVLTLSASEPLAVLKLPVVLSKSALKPVAVLSVPVVLFKSASSPRTVFWFVKQPSRQTARACGESAKHARMRAMRKNRFAKATDSLNFLRVKSWFS